MIFHGIVLKTEITPSFANPGLSKNLLDVFAASLCSSYVLIYRFGEALQFKWAQSSEATTLGTRPVLRLLLPTRKYSGIFALTCNFRDRGHCSDVQILHCATYVVYRPQKKPCSLWWLRQ